MFACLFVCLPVYLHVMSIWLLLCLSVCLLVCLLTSLSVCMSACSVNLFVCLSVCYVLCCSSPFCLTGVNPKIRPSRLEKKTFWSLPCVTQTTQNTFYKSKEGEAKQHISACIEKKLRSILLKVCVSIAWRHGALHFRSQRHELRQDGLHEWMPVEPNQ